MTTHRSLAAIAGIMPDYAQAGVVLCRTGRLTTADDNMVSGDTLQMVPVPENAIILDIKAYANVEIPGATGCHIGDGSSPTRFFDDACLGDVNYLQLEDDGKPIGCGYCYDEGNDTIDIALTKAATKVPTSTVFTMHVWYKMMGSISDENWDGPSA